MSFKCPTLELACVASVSNRVIARKLERKQKKGCSCPSCLDEPREETFATQATLESIQVIKCPHPGTFHRHKNDRKTVETPSVVEQNLACVAGV